MKLRIVARGYGSSIIREYDTDDEAEALEMMRDDDVVPEIDEIGEVTKVDV